MSYREIHFSPAIINPKKPRFVIHVDSGPSTNFTETANNTTYAKMRADHLAFIHSAPVYVYEWVEDEDDDGTGVEVRRVQSTDDGPEGSGRPRA